MTDREKGTGGQAGRPKGGRAILGPAMTILGALAAVHQRSRLLQAISEAVPQLAAALPPRITACEAILAALSDPPEGRRK